MASSPVWTFSLSLWPHRPSLSCKIVHTIDVVPIIDTKSSFLKWCKCIPERIGGWRKIWRVWDELSGWNGIYNCVKSLPGEHQSGIPRLYFPSNIRSPTTYKHVTILGSLFEGPDTLVYVICVFWGDQMRLSISSDFVTWTSSKMWKSSFATVFSCFGTLRGLLRNRGQVFPIKLSRKF